MAFREELLSNKNNYTMENHKKKYTIPQLELVLLDNEIALALESNPPLGPNETREMTIPDYFKNDPYKISSI